MTSEPITETAPETVQSWTPYKPASERPKRPAVAALLAKAELVRLEAETTAERAATIDSQANELGQALARLETERREVQARLDVIGRRDFQAQVVGSKELIHRLYGLPTLSAAERTSLNDAVHALAWLPLLAKEIPGIVGDLQEQLADLDAELTRLQGK
jgi:hypothetical protein